VLAGDAVAPPFLALHGAAHGVARLERRLLDRPPRIPDLAAEDAAQACNLVPGDLDDASVQVTACEVRSKQVVVVCIGVRVVVPVDEPDLGEIQDRTSARRAEAGAPGCHPAARSPQAESARPRRSRDRDRRAGRRRTSALAPTARARIAHGGPMGCTFSFHVRRSGDDASVGRGPQEVRAQFLEAVLIERTLGFSARAARSPLRSLRANRQVRPIPRRCGHSHRARPGSPTGACC
jgi:hypothetical protein